MDGFLLIDKPIGLSSHDVVYQVKKKLHLNKVGHTGTLDPFASGLLILCVGKATKLADLFSSLDKKYEGTIIFNKHYDSYDVTGKIVSEKEMELSEQTIKKVAQSMIGTYEQYPPMFSAIQINGQRLYDLARKGIEIDRPARTVHVYQFNLGKLNHEEIDFQTHVSKGTYIRSLAVDLAIKLDTYAALKTLRRTTIGNYEVKNAKSINDISIDDLITVNTYFKDYKTLALDDYMIRLVKNGIYLDERQIITDQPFIVVDKDEHMVAYYIVVEENKYKPAFIF